jgi:hypothetical protein
MASTYTAATSLAELSSPYLADAELWLTGHQLFSRTSYRGFICHCSLAVDYTAVQVLFMAGESLAIECAETKFSYAKRSNDFLRLLLDVLVPQTHTKLHHVHRISTTSTPLFSQ